MAEKLCKICGLTRAEDVALCNSLGVDFMGFIFAPSSPRVVRPEFVASLPHGPARRVGVFTGASVKEMLAHAHAAKLDFFQLHGGEGPDICAELGAERVIKTLWPESCPPPPKSSAQIWKCSLRSVPFFCWMPGTAAAAVEDACHFTPLPPCARPARGFWQADWGRERFRRRLPHALPMALT